MKDFPWRETSIISRDGQHIPVRFSGTILQEKDKDMGTVAFFQDLREIKRLEKELVKSERLAAVGQTVAGLAHGIKNILHGLKGGSYLVDIGIKRAVIWLISESNEMTPRSLKKAGTRLKGTSAELLILLWICCLIPKNVSRSMNPVCRMKSLMMLWNC
jgi:hypothetical protein